MAPLDLLFGLVLTALIASAALSVILAIRWTRMEDPERTLLKPVTLCAALARVRSYRSILFRLALPDPRVLRDTKIDDSISPSKRRGIRHDTESKHQYS